MKNKNKPIIVVWFSCGAASAVAAYLTIQKYKNTHTIIIANTYIKEEDEDNRRFLKDVEKWLGQEIINRGNPAYPNSSVVEVWEKVKYMSNRFGAPCTSKLKKEARYIYEKEIDIAFHVLGYTADEKHRHDDFVKFERSNLLPILIDAGFDKEACFEVVEAAGIKLPDSYIQGYPNANCKGCPKASSPTYWNHVRATDPEIFKERAELSRRLGARLVRVKGKRIFLDELSEDAKGYKMKSYSCSLFCNSN